VGALAVSVTMVPELKAAVQEGVVQDMTDGELDTVPTPDMETLRFCVPGVSVPPPESPPPPPQATRVAATKAMNVLDAEDPKNESRFLTDMNEIDIKKLPKQ
jgi:hypothetical protein